MDIQWLHFIAHELSWRWSPLGRVGHQGVCSQPSAVLPVSCLQFSPRIVSSPISWKQVAPASVPLASVSLLSLCCTIFITQWMFLFEDSTAFHEKLFSPPNLSCVWGIPRVVVIILVLPVRNPQVTIDFFCFQLLHKQSLIRATCYWPAPNILSCNLSISASFPGTFGLFHPGFHCICLWFQSSVRMTICIFEDFPHAC